MIPVLAKMKRRPPAVVRQCLLLSCLWQFNILQLYSYTINGRGFTASKTVSVLWDVLACLPCTITLCAVGFVCLVPCSGLIFSCCLPQRVRVASRSICFYGPRVKHGLAFCDPSLGVLPVIKFHGMSCVQVQPAWVGIWKPFDAKNKLSRLQVFAIISLHRHSRMHNTEAVSLY